MRVDLCNGFAPCLAFRIQEEVNLTSKKEEVTMRTLRRLAGLIICGCLSWAGPARADAVAYWNKIA